MARILSRFQLDLDADELFARAMEGYAKEDWKLPPAKALPRLSAFFRARLRGLLQQQGKNTLLVDAAMGPAGSSVTGVERRLAALEAFAAGEGYTRSVQTFKRVANILAKQRAAGASIPESWDEALLRERPERELAQVLVKVLPELDGLAEARDYGAVLASLEALRPSVDAFFDGVMVACEDQALRANRLALLGAMHRRFAPLADFSALQV